MEGAEPRVPSNEGQPWPLGPAQAVPAQALAQVCELVWQLRGQSEKRQVEGAQIALQHNLGLGGACVVTMYRRDA